MKHFLADFPTIDVLFKEMQDLPIPEYREANCHVHTPYSFSSFADMDDIFRKAANENIAVLGINDFYVTNGYDTFQKGCVANKIFPLFNIEFIGLIKEAQKNGIRINDPDNPGRVYFCGKGLDYPFHPGLFTGITLKNVIKENQNQIRAMVAKVNSLIEKQHPKLKLSYESIKEKYAKDIVNERHIAEAIRILATKHFTDEDERRVFVETIFDGKKSLYMSDSAAAFENEIRSNLLKSGGAAFIEENGKSFPELEKIIKIIVKAGGIPCYPVILDDASGKYTEFESDQKKLLNSLRELNIGCIELITGRNEAKRLKNFVEFFHKNGFVITFGSAHNTMEMAPLAISARGQIPLDASLKKIAWEGACVIAAHQFLRIDGRQGFAVNDGEIIEKQKQDLARLGQMVIEYFLNYR